MDNLFEYTIPNHIMQEIMSIRNFKTNMFKELNNVFPGKWRGSPEEDPDLHIGFIMVDSTVGWAYALKKVLKRAHKQNIIEYYEQLSWYESDLFDDEICQYLDGRGKYEKK